MLGEALWVCFILIALMVVCIIAIWAVCSEPRELKKIKKQKIESKTCDHEWYLGEDFYTDSDTRKEEIQ